MSYRKISLQVDDFFSSIIELDKFNPNFKHDKYVELVYDKFGKLLICNNERFYYDSENRLSKIVSTTFNDQHFYITHVTTLEYFEESVLRKTVLVKSESFFSANNLSYTTDGINTISESPEEHNKLISSEVLTLDEAKAITDIKLFFHDEIDHNLFELNDSDKITAENDDFIYANQSYVTAYGNQIIQSKKFAKLNEPEIPLLIEIEIKVIYKDGAGHGTNYDQRGNIIEFQNHNYNPDSEADFFEEKSGKNIYGYDNNNKLSYLENENEIAVISIDHIEKIKIETGVIINKRKTKVEPWYTLFEREIESIESYNY